jgi:hypothetical protein
MQVSTPSDVPFAVASDGTVYINVTRFEGPVAADLLLHRANLEPGALFVGVALSNEEVKALLDAVGRAASEASAHICGARMWSRGKHQ